jgi:OFA family oxalate/formate antiporter-like MFS transporter
VSISSPGSNALGPTLLSTLRSRWAVLAAATAVQLALGAVYTWSIFGAALGPGSASVMQLSAAEASAPFSACLGTIFVGAFLGGRLQDKHGPRIVVLVGGVIYALGVYGASFAHGHEQYWLLVVSYGLVGGFGTGMAYVTPTAMLQKWFPDRRALATAIAVTGFGFGGVLTATIAAPIIAAHPDDPTAALRPLALIYLIMVVLGGMVFRNPPPGGVSPAIATAVPAARSFTLREALSTWQWTVLTATLAVNVAASVAFIGTAGSAGRAMVGLSGQGAAVLVSVIAVANGLGRLLWATVSERVDRRARRTGRGAGRISVFPVMLFLQGFCLVLLPMNHSVVVFFAAAVLIGLCCGGGFGTMPAMCADYFGLKHAGAIYGLMLVGWSIGGIVGPWWLSRDLVPPDAAHYATAFILLGIATGCFSLVTAVSRPPALPSTARLSPAAGAAVDGPFLADRRRGCGGLEFRCCCVVAGRPAGVAGALDPRVLAR